MSKIPLVIGLCVSCLTAAGCAVTEPDDRDTERVRAAVWDGDTFSIPGLASDLGISEVAVVAALPGSMAVKLPADDLESVMDDLCGLAPVQVAFAGPGARSEMRLEAPLVVELASDERMVLSSEAGQARVELNPADLVYIWLLRLPGEGRGSGGGEVLAVGFFGSGGERVMQWTIEREGWNARRFEALWDRSRE